MARIKIIRDDLFLALESHSYDSSWVLDLQTGEVIFLPDDRSFTGGEELEEIAVKLEAGSDSYRIIDPLPAYLGIDIMAEFAERVTDRRMQERLFRALNGRHPFRNFKDALCEDGNVRQLFFESRDERMAYYAQRWLDDEDIDAELIARPQQAQAG